VKRFLSCVAASLLVLGLLAAPVLCQADEPTIIDIVVSPSTINLDSQGVWVTVHADIPYSWVEGASVTLDGVPVNFTKADDCGDLVAKFTVESIRALFPNIDEPVEVNLTLCGDSLYGPFSGTDTVRVIKVSGKRK